MLVIKKTTRVGEDVEKGEPHALLVGMQIGTTTMINCGGSAKNLKRKYHTVSQFHLWIFIWRKQKSKRNMHPQMWLCCCSVTLSCPPLCDLMDCSIPGFPGRHQLLELAQTHVRWVSDATQPSHPLSSPATPAFYLSQHQGLFQWVGSSYQMAKLISFRVDWLDLLAVQGTLKSLFQHHSSKASILPRSAYNPALTSIHDYWKNHSFD